MEKKRGFSCVGIKVLSMGPECEPLPVSRAFSVASRNSSGM